MRILHTSDWHLGRTFHGASLAAEQAAVLDALVELVRTEGVDVVLVAGDLYDRALPSLEAIGLLDHALTELVATGATVVAISGNHDSGPRLSFGTALLAAGGLHLRTDPRTAGTPVLVGAPDGGPDLAVYAVPYLEPEIARHQLGAQGRSHDALVRHALDRARADRARRGRVRAVAMAHAFVHGGVASDSERVLCVGGSEEVATASVAGFDYVALGHLHGPQRAGADHVRYAGSPLPYSFSERRHTKAALLVDLPPHGGARVREVPLGVGRGLACVEGPLETLLSSAEHTEAETRWLRVTLHDQVVPRDAMARLRRRFPHAVLLEHAPPVPVTGGGGYAERVRARSDLELVQGFSVHVTGAELDPDERAEVADAIDAAARAEASADEAGRRAA